MTSVTPEREILIRRKTPWRRRLSVRIALTLMLIMAIVFVMAWWPRRAAFAIRWSGGKVMAHEDFSRQRKLRKNSWFSLGAGSLEQQLNLAQWLSWWQVDEGITWIDVQDSTESNCPRFDFRAFRNVIYVGLNDVQLASGLGGLSDRPQLTLVRIEGPSADHLANLKSIERLQSLELNNAKSGLLGLPSLAELPDFTELMVLDSKDIGGIFHAIPNLPRLKLLHIERCSGFSDADLESLRQVESLQVVIIENGTLIGDRGLTSLSKLEGLEVLSLEGSLGDHTTEALMSLGNLQKLQTMTLSGSQVSPEDVKKLQGRLPNCTMRIR